MTTSTDLRNDTAWMRSAFVDVQAELALKVKRANQSIEHAGSSQEQDRLHRLP